MLKPILDPLDFSTNIKDYFSYFNLNAYICLNPFVKVPKHISVEEYANSSALQAESFFYAKNPENYVSWESIVKELDFPSISYLNEVLMVGDNSLAKTRRFHYEELKRDSARLYSFLNRHNINQLSEGCIATEYQVAFLNSLLSVGYKKAVGADEFEPDGEEFNILEKVKWLESKQYLDYRSIFTNDIKVNFVAHWDCFFTVIAATSELLPKILESYPFEGFYPDDETTFLL